MTGVLLGAKHDACPRQVVRGQLDGDLVAGQDADVVHAHLPGDVAEHNVPVLQLHPKRGVGQILENLALHLNDVVLCHSARLEVRFFQQRFILLAHQIILNLSHKIHSNNNNN